MSQPLGPTGEFSDPELEARFLDEFAPELRRRTVVLGSVLLAVWCSMAVADALVTADVYTPWMTVLRIVGAVLLSWSVARGASTPRRQQWLTMAGMVTFSACWVGIALLNGVQDNHRLWQVGLLIFGLAASGLLTVPQLALTSLGIAVPQWLLYIQHTAGAGRWSDTGLLVGAIAFGLALQRSQSTVQRLSHLARWRLADIVTAREQLVAAMGHELRSPLASMRLLTEMAREETTAEGRRWLDQLDEGVEELSETVLAVMRLGSLSSGEPLARTDTVSTTQVWEWVLADLRGVPGAERIELRDDPDAPITVHAVALRSAVRNVVANAVRYGDEAVILRTRLTREHCDFIVEDDGPGVPTAEQSGVFHPSVRTGRGREKDQGGVGLGLAVTRRVLRGHGGDVHIERSGLGGARVVMSIPLKVSPETPRKSPSPTPP